MWAASFAGVGARARSGGGRANAAGSMGARAGPSSGATAWRNCELQRCGGILVSARYTLGGRVAYSRSKADLTLGVQTGGIVLTLGDCRACRPRHTARGGTAMANAGTRAATSTMTGEACAMTTNVAVAVACGRTGDECGSWVGCLLMSAALACCLAALGVGSVLAALSPEEAAASGGPPSPQRKPPPRAVPTLFFPRARRDRGRVEAPPGAPLVCYATLLALRAIGRSFPRIYPGFQRCSYGVPKTQGGLVACTRDAPGIRAMCGTGTRVR